MGSPNRQALKRVVYHFGGREKRRVRDACKNGQMQSVVPRILVCQQVATEFIGLIRSDLSGCFRISPAVPVLSSSGTRNWNLEVAAAVIACFLGMHRGVELGPAARQVLTLSSTALAGAACPCLPIVLRSNITECPMHGFFSPRADDNDHKTYDRCRRKGEYLHSSAKDSKHSTVYSLSRGFRRVSRKTNRGTTLSGQAN